MLSRKILLFLVLALPVLVVIFAVLMAGYLLAESVADSVGAAVLRWTAMTVLLFTVVDLLLLVATLGIRAISVPDDPSEPPVGS